MTKHRKNPAQQRKSRLVASTLLAGVASVGLPMAAGLSVSLSARDAAAQDLTSSTLAGHVIDESGNPVPGATVTVTSNARGNSATTTTNASGGFVVPQIPIGSYTVTVNKSGYRQLVSRDVPVSLGTTGDYDLQLVAAAGGGSNEEAIVVTARRNPALDFDRSTTGVTVDVQDTFNRQPMERTLSGVVGIAPQISLTGNFTSPLGTTRDQAIGPTTPSISGSSVAENIYYINGMNITNFRNFLGGSTVPFAFYDQVEVKTGGYQAEFGRSTGGAIIGVTRSGSNEFHGGVDAYWAPQGLRSDGRNAISSIDELCVDEDCTITRTVTSYQVGRGADEESYEGDIWLSGPIIPDRLFFFGLYNPRHFVHVSQTSPLPMDPVGEVATITDTYTREDPFYGGKLDFHLTDTQRFELTYFSDDQNAVDENLVEALDGNDIVSIPTHVDNFAGGETTIFKYTGNWTDWFTLSLLYGQTIFDQSTISNRDDEAAVYLNGGIVRGNPALLTQTGSDERKNYRIDADFYFDWMGSHHVRVGYDREDLTADQVQRYSGGIYYRYYGVNQNCGGTGIFSDNCVRVRQLDNTGSFDVQQQGIYLQDAWDVTDRLSLQLGVRSEDFENFNADGVSFLHTDNQVAPRIGITYDPSDDRSVKLSAFFGRYYLPIAANTNIRGSGNEIFQEDFYIYTGQDPDSLVPVLGTLLSHQCLEGRDDGANCLPTNPEPTVLASANLEPQYQDEIILGVEKRFANDWRFGVNVIYRKLQSVLEDTNLDNPNGWHPFTFDSDGDGNDDMTLAEARNFPDNIAILSNYCVYAGITPDQCGSFGNGGYILINPGSDAILTIPDNGTWDPALVGTQVVVPASVVGLPEAEREYSALELTFERPWDGRWSLSGSYVLSETRGNYEGGVKSDNFQTDTGGTQDFDQIGWMDGSFGLLPNHHAHQLKIQGSYQITPQLLGGFTYNLLSPRHYGCIGFYPGDGNLVPRADSNTLGPWYCNGQLTPRGSQFEGDWIQSLDLSFAYTVPQTAVPGNIQFRADIFNVFDTQEATILNEFGEKGGPGTPNLAYRTPSAYQTPRYVRLGFSYNF